MGPLLQREYVDSPPWTLSLSLIRAFQFFVVALTVMPPRVAEMYPEQRPCLVVASDAQADQVRPSGAT